MGNDIRYMPEKLEQASNFANKIWNAAKFIIMNRPEEEKIIQFRKENYVEEKNTYKDDALTIEDKWMMNKLNTLIREITVNIENYDLGVALDKLYNFMWNEFCDWYIEMAKLRLYGEDENAKIQVSFVLNEVFRNCLKLLHPFMPFVTSEIYDKLVNYDSKELMVSDWPKTANFDYKAEENMIELVKEIIIEIRNIRNTKNIHPSKKSKLIFVTKNDDIKNNLKSLEKILLKFGFGDELIIQKDKTNIPENSISIVRDNLELYMPLEGLIHLEEEKKRIEAERARLKAEVERCQKMLSNPGFVNKAPKAKVEEEREKLKKYQDMLDKI